MVGLETFFWYLYRPYRTTYSKKRSVNKLSVDRPQIDWTNIKGVKGVIMEEMGFVIVQSKR